MSDSSQWARPEGDPPQGPAAAGEGDPASPAVPTDPGPPASTPAALSDAEGEDQPLPEQHPGAPPPPAQRRARFSLPLLLSLLGAMVILLGGLIAGLLLLVLNDGDGGSDNYPSDIGDDEFDLEAMSLRMDDLPEGLALGARNEFDNLQWALNVIGEADPDPAEVERRESQLDSRKRIRGVLSVFFWRDEDVARPGDLLNVFSQSTLYESDEAAQSDLGELCGLDVDETRPPEPFDVPDLGDEAVGFSLPSIYYGTATDTVVCFRTGRVVHGVVQIAFRGSEDPKLTVELAKRMLERVEHAFDGEPDPLDEPIAVDEG
jgi:hypothetical protein